MYIPEKTSEQFEKAMTKSFLMMNGHSLFLCTRPHEEYSRLKRHAGGIAIWRASREEIFPTRLLSIERKKHLDNVV